MQVPPAYDLGALQGDLSGLGGRPVPENVTDPEAYRAARGFESVLTRQLVKQMMGEMKLIGGKGMGGQVFEDMFVNVLGEEIASSGSLGVTEMIYRKVMEGKGQDPFTEPPGHVPGIPEGPLARTHAPREREARVPDAINWGALTRRDPSFSDDVRRYERLARRMGARHGVEPELILAVMQQESRGDARAVSHAGAKGLMQLIDSTAAAMGVSDSFNPRQNVEGGARYLAAMLEQFDGKLEHALAAYNAGPGAVRRYGGIPPYRETRDYVRKVTRNYEALIGLRPREATDRFATGRGPGAAEEGTWNRS